MQKSIKIQLPLDALERLIGGNAQAEIELRSGVVQAFAKRHLKGVLDESALEKIREQIRSEGHKYAEQFQEAIREEVGEWGMREFKLTSSAKTAISTYVKDALRDLVREEMQKGKAEVDKLILDQWGRALARINDTIMRVMPATIEQTIHDKIKARLAEIANRVSEASCEQDKMF
jgi:hypothetical protein